MDIPVFYLDGLGNRFLIAIMATLVVVIKYPVALGAYPLMCGLEWRGIRTQQSSWDSLAKRIALISFLIVCSLGVLSTLGHWLISALVSPLGLGSSVRIFFWNWLFQWLLLVSEVVLIVAYYFTWDRWRGRRKSWHLAMGLMLTGVAWTTIASGLLMPTPGTDSFARKPYIIEGYMYSNGVRVDQLALLQHEGILAHSAYHNFGPINESNRIEAGKHVFLLTCSGCHTTHGIHSVITSFDKLYGAQAWDVAGLDKFLSEMQQTRPYMPPFPGNAEERQALSAYLCSQRENPQTLQGDQSTGIARPQSYQPEPSSPVMAAAENTHVFSQSLGQ